MSQNYVVSSMIGVPKSICLVDMLENPNKPSLG